MKALSRRILRVFGYEYVSHRLWGRGRSSAYRQVWQPDRDLGVLDLVFFDFLGATALVEAFIAMFWMMLKGESQKLASRCRDRPGGAEPGEADGTAWILKAQPGIT